MEKEKLNDAAKINADEICDSLSECWFNDDGGYTDRELEYNDLIESFKSGAEWLMGQPIAERLSEEERKTLRELYDCYKQHESVCKKKGLYDAEMIARGSTATMRDIFGKEMFENK